MEVVAMAAVEYIGKDLNAEYIELITIVRKTAELTDILRKEYLGKDCSNVIFDANEQFTMSIEAYLNKMHQVTIDGIE